MKRYFRVALTVLAMLLVMLFSAAITLRIALHGHEVTIPDLAGMTVGEASDAALKTGVDLNIDLRRMSLDLGTLAHIDAPGDPDMTLAQTPPPNAGVDQPRVNLLLSSTSGSASSAFVLPSFVGMSYAAANHQAMALGLRVALVGEAAAPAAVPAPAVPGAPPVAAVVPAAPSGVVAAQTPEFGFRASKGDVLRLTLAHPAVVAPAAVAPAAATAPTKL
jgi:beta-lactam-binding protein with PASTA domain